MTAGLHPEIVPDIEGHLDAGDGHRIFWQVSGNPSGKAALILHGGPGSGSSPTARRWFDPARYRIVQFDQRGCGRSTPHAGRDLAALRANTLAHSLGDIERLRDHLGIDRWMLLGGSWGATLALAYAQAYPHRVTDMVLNSVATTTRGEIDWITRGAGAFLPEAYEQFRAGLPESDRKGDAATGYLKLMVAPDPDTNQRAADSWCAWEAALVAVHPAHVVSERWADPTFRLGFARLVTHCWSHGGWLEEGQLLRDIGRLSRIPSVLIHGRFDISGPLAVPWHLAKAWPSAELRVVAAAGHDARDPGMAESIIAAIDRFATT